MAMCVIQKQVVDMLYPIVLSGGVGARLWPLSRSTHPKPFIRLEDGKSLLQHAFLRAARLPDVNAVMTVTNRVLLLKTQHHYRQLAAEYADQLSAIASHFILEPFARNTAPAIALASLCNAEAHGEDAVLLILAADHLIANQAAFTEAVGTACELARDGKIVTFGVQPQAPESAYGYIEYDGNQVVRFIEKPSQEMAREYLASGTFLWNAGMFCCSAGVMLAEMEKHCPDILNSARHCLQQAQKSESEDNIQIKIDRHSFADMRPQSIDYALLEHTDKAAVVACDIGWSDIGSWAALGEQIPADRDGNRIDGDVVVHDSKNCTIKSKNRVVGVVGLENMLIVDSEDALLVADKDKHQQVKQIYDTLKQQHHEAHEYHQTVERQWGTYTVLDAGVGYKVKRIEVFPGRRLSLQSHQHRSEHWTIIEGVAEITNGDEQFTLHPNQSTYIECRHKHRLGNPGELPLIIIEVQVGSYLGEDDIVRY